jgi:hypothetical protein
MERQFLGDNRSLVAAAERLLRKSHTARRIGQHAQAQSLEVKSSELFNRANGAPKPRKARQKQESYC